MKRFIYIPLLGLVILLGCEKESNKAPAQTPSANVFNDSQDSRENCYRGKLEEILADGRTALVRSLDNRQDLHYWDIVHNRAQRKIVYPFDYYRMSFSGQYFIRSFSQIRFQILSMSGEQTTFRNSILMAPSRKPHLDFSRDSQLVLMTYRRQSSAVNTVVLHDIKRKDIVWSGKFLSVQKVAANNVNQVGIVAMQDGKRSLFLLDGERNYFSLQRPLLSGELEQFKISRSALVVLIQGVVYSYDLHDGHLYFEKKIKNIISVDQDFALVEKDNGHLALLNLVTGEFIGSYPMNRSTERSSCRLSISANQFACKNTEKQAGIVIVYLTSGQQKRLCFQI
jgi:hypothetical protein